MLFGLATHLNISRQVVNCYSKDDIAISKVHKDYSTTSAQYSQLSDYFLKNENWLKNAQDM